MTADDEPRATKCYFNIRRYVMMVVVYKLAFGNSRFLLSYTGVAVNIVKYKRKSFVYTHKWYLTTHIKYRIGYLISASTYTHTHLTLRSSKICV